jgi:hypothetical protein
MQCPACEFENLPGLQQCARCGSVLALAGVDVQPFRAADRGARIRYWRHRIPRIRINIPAIFDKLITNSLYSLRSFDETSLLRRAGAVLLSIIPGMGLVLLGRRRRGRAYLSIFAGCMALATTFMGSALGWIFFILAAGVQTYSIAECMFYHAERFSRGTTIVAGLAIVGMLYQLLYPAVGWLMHGMAQFEAIGGQIAPAAIAEGDVLVISGRWFKPATYSVGDLVSYNMAPIRAQNWQINGGISIDRVIGGPGDHMVCKNQVLTRNGQPVPLAGGPLVNLPIPDLDITVPTEMYFIFPSLPTLHGNPRGLNEARLSACVVPQSDIRGRVWMRIGPPYRIGRIR